MAFKQKMVQRLTGNSAVSASQLARETGVRQQNLSRWLQDARSLPIMAKKPKPSLREWTVVRSNSRHGYVSLRNLQTRADSGMIRTCCSWQEHASG